MRDIKTYLIERLIDLTKLQKQQEETRQSPENRQPANNKLWKEQDNRSQFQEQADAEKVERRHKTLEGITAKEVGKWLEIEKETIRIRGEEFEK